jgi:hypothetical protein
MRRLAPCCLLLLTALPLLADEPKPDYSRETLLKMFAPRPPDPPLPPGRVQWHVGYAEFRAWGMNWRVMYLPLLAPLPGSRPNDLATLPNPFALTGTPYASTMPPMFDNDRPWAVEREYRRILRMERKRRR